LHRKTYISGVKKINKKYLKIIEKRKNIAEEGRKSSGHVEVRRVVG
jgi:hypothetical protein